MQISKTKILYIITKSVWGGAQKYVFDLASNLNPENFDVHVACGRNGTLTEKLIQTNIPVYAIHNFQKSINPFREVAAWYETYRLITQIQPEIVHTNSSKAGGIGGSAAWICKLIHGYPSKIVFTAHGWAFSEPRPTIQLWLLSIASRLTALVHTNIITVSEFDRQQALTNHIAPASKLVTIPNGTKDITFLEKSKAQQELLGSEHPMLIGTVAEWTKNKGLEHLIAAMPDILAIHPTAKLCLIGWGESEQQLHEQIQRLGLEHTVHMLSKSPAAPYLQAFDAFVLSSLKEGFPYTLVEASLGGLPIVASRVGGIPEIITHNKTGLLIHPASSTEIAESVIKLLSEHSLRSELGSAAQLQAKQRFSFEQMLAKTITVYRS